MLVFAYLALFLALSAWLTCCRVANYKRHYEKRPFLAGSALHPVPISATRTRQR